MRILFYLVLGLLAIAAIELELVSEDLVVNIVVVWLAVEVITLYTHTHKMDKYIATLQSRISDLEFNETRAKLNQQKDNRRSDFY